MKKTIILLALLLTSSTAWSSNHDFSVTVLSAGKPISNAQVMLWQAQPGAHSKMLAKSRTTIAGKSNFDALPAPDSGFYYFTSKGGEIDGREVPRYAGLAVLRADQHGTITINEITTIGSLWPLAAQFTGDSGISGSANGLLVGSQHVQNLVDLSTGAFGATVLDGANLAFSETVARMNTLAALMSLCGTPTDAANCDKFIKVANAENTLTALRNIAVQPYRNTKELFTLFTTSFPYPEGKERRATNFLPYLSYVPEDFALVVRLSGGGIYSAGRLMFDDRGQLWSGQNWMPGSQSGLITAIGGGVVRLSPSGEAISPALVGYNGQGLDGIGWGTTVSADKVWVSGFNGIIGVFDLDGNVLGPATVNGENGALQGLATAPNGDVWVCDNQLNQLIRFPNGDHTKGEIVKVPGLKRPFAVAVDNRNVVWVTNNGFITATRFPADQPEKAQQIQLGGMAPRGLAIDSSGHVWVGNNFSMGYPLAKIPEGANIIEEFKLNIEKVLENEKQGITKTGNLTLISPEGRAIQKQVLEGVIYGAWGVSIAGDDTVFIGDFLGTGFIHMCGTNEKLCPDGKKTGEMIHYYESGLLEESTDTMVDDAGNVWMANNWDVIPALIDDNPDRRTATRGGGTGIVVIYGIGKPVTNPLIGQVRTPD
jgi:sugar lactone lactonase YvrE